MTLTVAPPPAGASSKSGSAFRVERQNDLAIIWFDLPGEKVNKFSSTVMQEFGTIVDDLARSNDIRKVIFASAKSSIFIAGADVTEFTRATSDQEASAYEIAAGHRRRDQRRMPGRRSRDGDQLRLARDVRFAESRHRRPGSEARDFSGLGRDDETSSPRRFADCARPRAYW